MSPSHDGGLDDADPDDECGLHEFPDDEADTEDELAYKKCPHCGAEVYEEVEQCPQCDEWIVPNTSPWQGRSWWWIVLGLAGIAMVLYLFSEVWRFQR